MQNEFSMILEQDITPYAEDIRKQTWKKHLPGSIF